jgi:hypothetical protein
VISKAPWLARERVRSRSRRPLLEKLPRERGAVRSSIRRTESGSPRGDAGLMDIGKKVEFSHEACRGRLIRQICFEG